MQHQDVVLSVRAELFQANGQIKVLEEGNLSLKQQVEQLQEQLKVRDELLRKEIKKRRGRFRAFMDVLAQLTEYQAKCETLDKENETLKEQVHKLKGEHTKLQDEVKQKEELVKKEIRKRQASTKSCLASELDSGERKWRRKVDQLETEKEEDQDELQVEQLQEQLKVRDELLRKEIKKRRGRFRAYVDVLAQLTEYQAKCENLETRLHQEPAQPETKWSREVEDLKKQVNLLQTEQRRLEDELKKKDELIVTKTKRHSILTTAYPDSLAMLMVKEKEVNKSQAETQEARLLQEMTQTEGVSSSKVEAVDKENETLKEQVHKLKGEHTKLQDEVKQKEELVKTEIRKGQASTKSCLASELDSVKRKRRRKVEQLETVKVEDQDELLKQETDYPPKRRGMRRLLP